VSEWVSEWESEWVSDVTDWGNHTITPRIYLSVDGRKVVHRVTGAW
jgi:hypothetical protein